MKLRAATPDDGAAIAEIYAPYVEGSPVSFEVAPPSPDEMRARIAAADGLYPWLAGEDEDGVVAGYAYASAFRARPAYRFAVETSIYLRQSAQRRGLGGALYAALIDILEAQGFAQAIGAISLPNDASVRLHERLGFIQAGAYRRVGYKLGQWWDVGLWQRGLATLADPPAEPRPLGSVLGTGGGRDELAFVVRQGARRER